MPENYHEMLYDHHGKLSKIETILETVVTQQEKLTDSMSRISISLEKLVNFEANTKESFVRVHSRIDDIEKDCDSFNKKLDDFEIVRFAVKYPKITALVALGMYSLTIDDLRKLILGI